MKTRIPVRWKLRLALVRSFGRGRSGRLRVRVIFGLSIAAVALSLAGALREGDWGPLVLNLGTDLAGALVVYLLIQMGLGRQERREDLAGRMGSRVREVAIEAVERLSQLGWLYDGSLKGIDLFDADLEGAHLLAADLRRAQFVCANLKGANLWDAKLQGACFEGADLREAELSRADLRGVDLAGASLGSANFADADLRGSRLTSVGLEGTCFRGALLSGAQVRARLRTTTILPDGSTWSSEGDFARFTDPDHPKFWQPSPPGG